MTVEAKGLRKDIMETELVFAEVEELTERKGSVGVAYSTG